MVILNKPDMNYGVWAENGNTLTPSSEKVEEGWVIEKPLNEHMNWVQNRQDKMLQYLNQRGMAEWDFRTEYPKDAYVVRSGSMYRAIVQNMDKDPTQNPSIWRKPFAELGDADNAWGEIDNIKNQDGYLRHYVRIKEPVMTGACKGYAYMDSTGKTGYRFQGDIPTIVRNNKTTASFSGGSLPNDVVTHQQLGARLQGYKIGDIYITTADGDPKTRLGYGTWERFAQGEVLVGFSTSVSNKVPQWVKTAGSEFGSYTHTLTEAEIPSHKHQSNMRIDGTDGTLIDNNLGFTTTGGKRIDWLETRSTRSTHTTDVGGDKPHNNVQPSIVVYMWKRTA